MTGTPEPWPADPEAGVSALYAAHQRTMVRVAVLMLGDQAAAEDVVQDAFIAVHRRWRRLDRDRVVGYLRRSVVNGARSALRHRSVVDRLTPRPGPDEPGADTHVVEIDQRDQVLAALAELPARQREVLSLRYYLDLSETEIADALDISRGSVKTHASRGAAALRQTLGDLR